MAKETNAKVTKLDNVFVLNIYTNREMVIILIAFSKISIRAGAVILEVP